MQTEQEFEELEHVWIPMPDGVRLAARMWRPISASTTPVPAIFEYIPYRKADMVRARDERNHPFLAAHGYAAVRVDMRGSGDSEGVMPDMYADLELSDARHVIDWIAAQDWCDGKVGMFGTSWGGTAALQANVDAPGPLKAIIAVCATHDRYEDDIHHMGGCLLTDTLEWGATLPAILAAPPTPNIGQNWRQVWQERLENSTFPLEFWIAEEARGTYWRHGSVIHQADRLSRPILAIGGWSDRYSNSVMRLAAARPDLVKGIVGPWGHHYPDHGEPGPAIGFQDLSLAWWDLWLRGQGDHNDWPHLRVWIREHEPTTDRLVERAGGWVQSGPISNSVAQTVYALTPAGLEPGAIAEGRWMVPNDLRIGRAAGDTGYFGRVGGLPLDQQDDDAAALSFDAAPQTDECVLFGFSKLDILTAAKDGQIIARLCDVAPDGASVLICRAMRNLSLDDNLDQQTKDSGTSIPRKLRISFPSVAYRLAKGHRLRLSLSSSYWPLIWPAAQSQSPLILGGQLRPAVSPASLRPLDAPFPVSRDLPPVKSYACVLKGSLLRWRDVSREGLRRDGWQQEPTETYYAQTQTTFGYETSAHFSLRASDPLSAMAEVSHRNWIIRPDGKAEVQSTVCLTSSANYFTIKACLSAYWDGICLAHKDRSFQVPRRFG